MGGGSEREKSIQRVSTPRFPQGLFSLPHKRDTGLVPNLKPHVVNIFRYKSGIRFWLGFRRNLFSQEKTPETFVGGLCGPKL